MKRKPKLGLPRLFDRPKYRQRNIIERMLGWLQQHRRMGSRYDKRARRFAMLVSLACILRYQRRCFSYRIQSFRHPCRIFPLSFAAFLDQDQARKTLKKGGRLLEAPPLTQQLFAAINDSPTSQPPP